MTFLGVATLVLLVIVGFLVAVTPGVLWSQVDFGVAPRGAASCTPSRWRRPRSSAWTPSPAAPESALRPARDVPRAINLVLPLIVALAVGLAVVALSALPVGSNVVPVDASTGLTRPVPVVPGDEPGVFVLAADPSTQVVVPGGAARARGTSSPRRSPRRPVVASPDGPVTRLYGTLLGSAYLQDPVMGLVASLPDEPRAAQGRPAPVARHPHRHLAAARRQRRPRRIGAHRSTRWRGTTRCRPPSAACTPRG